MAFGGVETGSIIPQDAPNTAASAGITGLTPAEAAIGSTIGTTIVALAVLEVVSEINRATIVERMDVAKRLDTPRPLVRPSPIVSARPVSERRVPSAMPEPKSRIVPQSIHTASFQLSLMSSLKKPSSSHTGNTSPGLEV